MATETDLVETKLVNEELGRQRQRELVAATIKALEHKPFHKLTMREIAKAAGWHSGRLYLYISTKEDLLYLVMDTTNRDVLSCLDDLQLLPTAREALIDACRRLYFNANRYRVEAVIVNREMASLPPEKRRPLGSYIRQRIELLAGIVRRGIEGGEFQVVDADMVAFDIMMVSQAWATREFALPFIARRDIAYYADYHINMFLSVLGAVPVDCVSVEEARSRRRERPARRLLPWLR